ncbi:class I SAM-dependent methyltransferase [Pseudonocardia adelaidensis]|uniref:Class I SAM-dependent methyltransferase n=1 Tax=Pseudonocardia adelaidensis TaxID=648754 RepID=A0ABP9PA05_9PSEU
MVLPAFTPAQESLFLTLSGRALDSRLPHPFLGDRMADEILRKTGYDPLARFPTMRSRLVDPRTKVFDIAVRAKRLDAVVRAFVGRHPNAVVVDMGAGLDGRVFRVDPPPTVDWYDIDLPEVIALRERVVPRHAHAHAIAADVTDERWLDGIPAERPAVIVADGLVAFLPQDGFVSLLGRLTSHFPSGELAFNAYTTVAVWATRHLGSFATIGGGVVNPGFNDPHEPERRVPALTLAEEIFLTRAPELAAMPLAGRLAARMIAGSAWMSRMSGTTVLRYRF